ncbi:AzlD domain-containing protein [Brucepastera parasyntrophica]|uniref:branched-chain amino acid transporter permease n=1 Tax=Brucepastera parasyntrophica TaxID=2880008 RepID=UPI002109044F|nr:AzlD domain-containing protein [Brucepastera parasyntrophica]ULQ60621.1 AzlD domain-containing protein [Brucepastera parasyntrophica]
MISLSQALIATFLFALIIFLTRAFPFLLFSRREPPALIRFIEQFIPPMVMAVLVIYCLKDVQWAVYPSGIRELIALAAVVVLHLWKNNAMLSIFGSTIIYMVLKHLL